MLLQDKSPICLYFTFAIIHIKVNNGETALFLQATIQIKHVINKEWCALVFFPLENNYYIFTRKGNLEIG